MLPILDHVVIQTNSHSSTVLLFQILNTLVDLPITISCCPYEGFALTPLPSSTAVWNALNVEDWQHEFGLTNKERTVYALSTKGELKRITKDKTILKIEKAEWEEWNAEVGDLGMLVMIVAALL